MKVVKYVGLIIFIVGIVMFFVRAFSETLLSGINDKLIDILWPIGLLTYSLAQICIKKSNKESSVQ